MYKANYECRLFFALLPWCASMRMHQSPLSLADRYVCHAVAFGCDEVGLQLHLMLPLSVDEMLYMRLPIVYHRLSGCEK